MKFALRLSIIFIIICEVNLAKSQTIKLESNDKKLNEAFSWAVLKARSHKVTGKRGVINYCNGPELGYAKGKTYIPSYWAGYLHRSAFYGRDFSHQSAAAHLVGMDEENFSMYEAFSKHASIDKKWYTWWALNFDGSVYTLDAPNPPGNKAYEGYPGNFVNPPGERYVREVAVMFDLIYRAYRCYLWTGDNRYINNKHLIRFYDKTMTDFIHLHDSNDNGIPEGIGDIWQGSATYNERDIHPLEGGDAIAIMYQARLAYANLLEKMNRQAESSHQFQMAESLRNYFNMDWSVVPGQLGIYSCALLHNGKKYTTYNRETTFLMPLYGITEPGDRNDQLLDLISYNLGDGYKTKGEGPNASPNIESYTYLPELFFKYNRREEAWKWMSYIIDNLEKPHEVKIQGANGDYPEVSFLLISHVIEGMMGIQPNAPDQRIETLPRLPKAINNIIANNIAFGQNMISVHHKGNDCTVIKLDGIADNLKWIASFNGIYERIWINNKAIKAKHKIVDGISISFVEVDLKNGDKLIASTDPK